MIKTIVFDLGQVVIKYDIKKFINSFVSKMPLKLENISVEDVKKEYGDVIHNFEKGLISSKDFYTQLSLRTHYKGTYNEFSLIWNGIFEKPTYDVINLIEKLKNKYKVFALSNTNELHIDYLRKNYPIVLNVFDKCFLSHEMHQRKPDNNIYQTVKSFSDDEIFFVDDKKENISGAVKNGFKAKQFTTFENLVNDLKSQGVQCD